MRPQGTAGDAVAVIAAALALHDAPDPTALLDALPRLVGDLIPFDSIELIDAGRGPGATLGHRLTIATTDSGGVLTAMLLGRRSRPFGPRDAAVARLLGPLVGAACDHVRLRVLHAGIGSGLSDLTARERQVLSLIADGRSSRDIADALFIERRTVEKHVEHIKAKLGAHSRAEAAAAWARAVVLAS